MAGAAALPLGVLVAAIFFRFRRHCKVSGLDCVDEADEDVDALEEDEVSGLRMNGLQVGSGW